MAGAFRPGKWKSIWCWTLAGWAFAISIASGQSPSPIPEEIQSASRPGILLPQVSASSNPDTERLRVTPTPVAGADDVPGTSAIPSAAALPITSSGATAGARDPAPRPAPKSPPHLPLDTTLIPGRVVAPIDLANALRLGGANSIDIAVARQQVNRALALLSQARSYWLPSLFYGPTWYRADGQVQSLTGQVQTVDRNSLFIGGTAALDNSFPAPSPGTGYPPLNTLSGTLRLSDAVFEPMAARRVVNANRAGVLTATNNALLQVTEAYFELQGATGRLAIAREAAANAEALAQITGAFAQAGQGLEADHRRTLAELRRRRREIQFVSGQLLVASANLVRLLILDPAVVMAPVEPPECILRLIPDDALLDELVVQGMRARPELANAQELIEAARLRLKQARLRPFVPSVAVAEAAGGFGGGQNAFFGNFGTRNDLAASVFWDLRGLGVMDCAIMRQRAAEHETARLEKIRVQAQVAADVISAFETRQTAARQITEAQEALIEAIESLQLNFLNIRQGTDLPRATRPIEVLQPIQALAQARVDYLDSVLGYNRAQFRLERAIGQTP